MENQLRALLPGINIRFDGKHNILLYNADIVMKTGLYQYIQPLLEVCLLSYRNVISISRLMLQIYILYVHIGYSIYISVILISIYVSINKTTHHIGNMFLLL